MVQVWMLGLALIGVAIDGILIFAVPNWEPPYKSVLIVAVSSFAGAAAISAFTN